MTTWMDMIDELTKRSLIEQAQMTQGEPKPSWGEWIDVSESLPEPYELVLADAKAYILAYVGEIKETRDGAALVWCVPGQPNFKPKVACWMPLPKRRER